MAVAPPVPHMPGDPGVMLRGGGAGMGRGLHGGGDHPGAPPPGGYPPH